MKRRLAAVSPREILRKFAGLLITQWNFTKMPGAPDLGPVAQSRPMTVRIAPAPENFEASSNIAASSATYSGESQCLNLNRRSKFLPVGCDLSRDSLRQ